MNLNCILLSSSTFLALPKKGSHIFIIALWLHLLISTYVLLGIVSTSLFVSIYYFFSIHAWTLAIHITLPPFCDPSRGDCYYEWTPICYPLSISLHCLCSKHETLSHPTHSLQANSLCLPSCSLHHERVIHLVYFYLFFLLHGLFMKKTLCWAYY